MATSGVPKAEERILAEMVKIFPMSAVDLQIVEIRDCGYDLLEGTKLMKSILATTCVKDIYVDNLLTGADFPRHSAGHLDPLLLRRTQ